MKAQYVLNIDGKIIGHAVDVVDDMPKSIGIFSPTEHYAEYRQILEDVSEIVRPLPESSWLRLMLELDSRGLALLRSDGVSLRFCAPHATVSPGFALLRLHEGKIWWRPT